MTDINLLGRHLNLNNQLMGALIHGLQWPCLDKITEKKLITSAVQPSITIYKHCDKGRQILCQGRLQVSTSIDEATKKVKYHHTMVVSSTHFLHDPNISSASI